MLIGYARVSKADGSQVIDLQKDALTAVGVTKKNIYEDYASGKLENRPNLQACLKALRAGDHTYSTGQFCSMSFLRKQESN